MSEPWDVPPFPAKGDDDQNDTYAGVGRVLSQWESIELELGHIYSLFVDRFEDIKAVREYGKPRIFSDRMNKLEEVAAQYFQRNPHQETEAQFDSIATVARNFSARRNDIAHSIVRPFRWTFLPSTDQAADPFEPMQFCATPPYFTGKKFDRNNMPVYAYTSIEMNTLTTALFCFCQDIGKLKFKLALGEDGVPA